MKHEQTKTLGQLNAYQIAGLAVSLSTIVAVGVALGVRRFFRNPDEGSGEHGGRSTTMPAVAAVAPSGVPHHFSENLVIPGFTETGEEITEQDAQNGRSPEGV